MKEKDREETQEDLEEKEIYFIKKKLG